MCGGTFIKGPEYIMFSVLNQRVFEEAKNAYRVILLENPLHLFKLQFKGNIPGGVHIGGGRKKEGREEKERGEKSKLNGHVYV